MSTAPEGPRRRRPTGLADPRREYTDDEHRLAAELRGAYAAEMRQHLSNLNGRPVRYTPSPQWDGCEDPGPEEGKPRPALWLKVARDLRALGYDPVAYVRRQFATFRGSGPPYPNMLLSPACRRAFEEDGGLREERVRVALLTQNHLAVTRIGVAVSLGGLAREDAWCRVLADDDLPLSPLFRYCVAASEGAALGAVAGAYRDDAMFQYCLDPAAYDRHWAGFLPEGFAAAAASRVSAAYSRGGRR